MTKKQFIEGFVINWLSTWSANNYDNYCVEGLHKELAEPPVEDAFDLAEDTWKYIHGIDSNIDKYLEE